MNDLELSWVINRMPKSDDRYLEIMSLENVEKARQFGLIPRSRDHAVRDAPESGQVEHALVGRPVFPDKSGAVEAEDHGKVLQGDVMDDLVICPLCKGGVDGAVGSCPAGGQPGRKRKRRKKRIERTDVHLTANDRHNCRRKRCRWICG